MVVTKPIFHPYWDWECFKNGMYENSDPKFELVGEAVQILGDQDIFFKYLQEMVAVWQKACEHHLTDPNINRRAWLGQACCCFAKSIPERTVRVAWGTLSDFQKFEANKTADKIIKEYEEKNRVLYNRVAQEGLL